MCGLYFWRKIELHKVLLISQIFNKLRWTVENICLFLHASSQSSLWEILLDRSLPYPCSIYILLRTVRTCSSTEDFISGHIMSTASGASEDIALLNISHTSSSFMRFWKLFCNRCEKRIYSKMLLLVEVYLMFTTRCFFGYVTPKVFQNLKPYIWLK